MHFLSDMLASSVVLVGMVFVTLGYWSADAVAALVVAAFIVAAAVKLGRQSLASLVDAAPEGASAAITAAVVTVRNVLAVERTRVRMAGATPFVDLLVAVSRALPLDHVANVKSQVVRTVQGQLPNAEVTVETIARADGDESVETQVRVIAANRGAAIHRLTVQRVDGRCRSASISRWMPILASIKHMRLQAIWRRPSAEWLDGGEASHEDYRQIVNSLIKSAGAGGVVDDVHGVRIRNTSIGLIVNFHCRLPRSMSVTQAHATVGQMERTVRALHSNVGRVIGHAEPSAS